LKAVSAEGEMKCELSMIGDFFQRREVANEALVGLFGYEIFPLEFGDKTARRFRGDPKDRGDLLAAEDLTLGLYAVAAEVDQQPRQPGPRRSGRKQGQPVVGLPHRLLPALHKLMIEPGCPGIELRDRRGGDAADRDFPHAHRAVLILMAQHRLQAGRVALAEKADDTLGTIGQILHQLHQPGADGEHRDARISGLIQCASGREGQILDRQVKSGEVVHIKIGKQGKVAHTTPPALRLSTPSRLNAFRFHILVHMTLYQRALIMTHCGDLW